MNNQKPHPEHPTVHACDSCRRSTTHEDIVLDGNHHLICSECGAVSHLNTAQQEHAA